MNSRTLVRALVTSLMFATGLALAGCNSDEISLANNAKANKPIPEKLVAEMQQKDMDPQSRDLPAKVSGEADVVHTVRDLENVMGVLPGAAGNDETIVIGAHYDHLGRGGEGSLAPD